MSDVELVEHLLVIRRHLQILAQVRALPKLTNLDQLTELLIVELLQAPTLVKK